MVTWRSLELGAGTVACHVTETMMVVGLLFMPMLE